MANKPTPADFSPTVPDFPSIGQYQPIYGKFDLTTYIQGASDYEIMSFLVQCYNATLKGYSDVTHLSKDTVTAYNQLQTWVNIWFAELDVQQEINNKLQSMYEAGTLATAIAQSNTIPPAVAQYLNSTEGTQNLSNVTAQKIEAMAASGALGTVINNTGTVQSTTTNWLQQNVTPTGSAVMVDKSLSVEGAAADAKATGNAFNNLSIYDLEVVKQNNTNLWDKGSFEVDYKGTRYAYDHKNIVLDSGTYNVVVLNSKFSNVGYLLVGLGEGPVGTNLIKIIGNGVYTFKLSTKGTVFFTFQVSEDTPASENTTYYIKDFRIYSYDGKILPYFTTGLDNVYNALKFNPKALFATKDRLTNSTFGIAAAKLPNNKTNYVISMSANVETYNNGSISVSYGGGIKPYAGSSVTVNSTSIIVSKYTTENVEVARVAHNVILNDTISITIIVHSNHSCDVIFDTAMWYQKIKNVEWIGCNGDLTVWCNSDVVLTNVQISYYPKSVNKTVWAFGDSYFDLWYYKVAELGFTDILMDGFSGRTSIQALESLKREMTFNTPKQIVWCLGMNDPDSDTSVNSSWLEVFNEVKKICSNNSIPLIVSTIPNTPTHNNKFKNEIIYNSGLRYIDIAKTVGSDINPSWYPGLLNVDNVHPTEAGMYVIGTKFMTELPDCIET